MRRFLLAAPMLLLVMALAAGLVGATDQLSPALADTAAEALADRALEPEPLPLCLAGVEPGASASTEMGPGNPVDVSPLDCNCNHNADCDRVCGEGGGTCFIGPICNNWPDFTGTCLCRATVDAR